jgi:hypothetical protein
MLGLVIVVPPVGLVFANSTLPKPTVTPRKAPKGCCGAGRPASGYALRGFSGAIDLHHLLGHGWPHLPHRNRDRLVVSTVAAIKVTASGDLSHLGLIQLDHRLVAVGAFSVPFIHGYLRLWCIDKGPITLRAIPEHSLLGQYKKSLERTVHRADHGRNCRRSPRVLGIGPSQLTLSAGGSAGGNGPILHSGIRRSTHF